ncbi:hypothetical protein [Streptomyces flavochromogenes]|uniref:hypothetical protein n=1 Tax=Streptomyces flavochromogenes TaxID=68199 RepID=UPI00131CB6EB|nr:hypothetical protein [Streptomyces flavochromogenes]
MPTPREKADDEILNLRSNLTTLGVAIGVTGPTRTMIRRYHATRMWFGRSLFNLFMFFFIPTLVLRIYLDWVETVVRAMRNPPIDVAIPADNLNEWWSLAKEANPIAFSAAVSMAFMVLLIGIISIVAAALLIYFVTIFSFKHFWRSPSRKYVLVHHVSNAIDYAARAYQKAPGSAKQQILLRGLSSELREIHKEVALITRFNKTITRSSHRRIPLHTHHLQVIAKLQEQERGIDVDVRSALTTLAETLTKVANAHSVGKIGELLSETEVGSLSPARSRDFEPLKMALTALMLSGSVLLVTFLDLPDAAVTSVVGAMGILAVSVIYGSNARRGLEILDSVRGIQRP